MEKRIKRENNKLEGHRRCGIGEREREKRERNKLKKRRVNTQTKYWTRGGREKKK